MNTNCTYQPNVNYEASFYQLSTNDHDTNNSPLDTNSIVTDVFKLSIEPYHQKLPISFISPKDWQKYLHFTNSVDVHSNNNFIKQKGKNARILRLFDSFYKLYEEYSVLYSKYNDIKSVKCSPKPRKMRKSNSLGKGEMKTDERLDSFRTITELNHSVFVQTNLSVIDEGSELKIKRKKSSARSKESYHLMDFLLPAKKLRKHFQQITTSKESLLIESKFYDKIFQPENELSMDIFEECEKQVIVSHRISLQSLDKQKFQVPSNKSIQIPLAIELLLPKIQIQIENILHQCPFLCDPLEVAAELRHLNYNEAACIEYFHSTKLLRSIIEEMMPNNVGSNNNEVRCNSSSSVSKNPDYGDAKSDNSEETITALNSMNNNTNNNTNVTKLLSNNPSVSNIFATVKDLCGINEVTQKSNSKNNRVHFYLDNKKFTRYFRSLLVNLTKMRQLYFETREEINFLNQQLSCVFNSLKSYIKLLVSQNNDAICDDQNGKLLTLSKQVEELKLKLKDEEKHRRHIYNVMQEQMGNIRVYCRCRHIDNATGILEVIGNDSVALPVSGMNERFEFDKVFSPSMSQKDVYEEFKPLVLSFLDGYNVCFITYGGEASGKTFTLIGGNSESNQQGLMHRALSTILTQKSLRQRDWEYKISASLVEIYNDNCIDVLSGETNVHLYVESGMEAAYQKLKTVPITNEADVDALMQVCRLKRKVAKTALNPASSRSHLITLIRLQGRSRIHGESICSFLCLCDLAGFEDIIKAETQTNKVLSTEAGYINRSLTAFNRVFVSLKKQDPNTVSYRDTKLTHLLKPFLINSGKCALLVTIRDDKRSFGSTQNTLRFGRESRGVSLGKARRQVNSSNLLTPPGNNNSNVHFYYPLNNVYK